MTKIAKRPETNRGTLKKNLLLLLASVLFGLLLLEGMLWVIRPDKVEVVEAPKTNWARVPERIWTEHHEILGWYHQPNKTATLVGAHFEDVEVKTNSAGFRSNREYSVVKSPGVKRIAVLGDSFAFGFGVRNDETFAAVMESKQKDLEAINLGVAGFGMDQILMSYRSIAAAYKPDVVILSIFPEDFWRSTRAFADSGHAKPYFVLTGDGSLDLKNVPVPLPYSLKYNQFPDVIDYSLVETFLRKSLVYRLSKQGIMKLLKNLKLIDPDMTTEWILGREILKESVEEIENAGSRVVIAIVPPERWVTSDRRTSLRKSIIRFAKKEKMDLIDLTSLFQEASAEGGVNQYYIEKDGHWTAKGHAFVADILLKHLKDKNYI